MFIRKQKCPVFFRKKSDPSASSKNFEETLRKIAKLAFLATNWLTKPFHVQTLSKKTIDKKRLTNA